MLNTQFVHRCLATLELAQSRLSENDAKSALYDLYRAACVKEFEIVSEQCAKLLRKSLLVFFASSKQMDALTYKDIFRYAGKHGLATTVEVERWLLYREHTAHEYGESYADDILKLVPQFLIDARNLLKAIEAAPIDAQGS